MTELPQAMRQILQNLGTGETLLAEVPLPQRRSGRLLVESNRSLVSLGTEKMLIEFGKAGWIAKARSQPDKVVQVLQKIKTDGLWATWDAVQAKLDTPIPLGYCNVGRVVETDGTAPFRVGDRVVSNGPHADFVAVPRNLTAAIPDGVDDETATFTVVAAIGLQGMRLVAPTIGERVVVIGLGLIGLLTVQMLVANGCQVLGVDYDPGKLRLARGFGAETVDLGAGQNPVEFAREWSRGIGVDGVLITAATKSDEVVHQAAEMCRQRGRIVLVGVVGLNLRRADFYQKELSFQVSCSYGPGRYDALYEDKGLDYPIGFVRWTEQRNFEAVLRLMEEGRLVTRDLVSHRFPFDQALDAYRAVGEAKALGILLSYRAAEPVALPAAEPTRIAPSTPGTGAIAAATMPVERAVSRPIVAFIGAGNFATRTLLPLLPHDVDRRWIVSASGVSAAHAARKFGFARAGSSEDSVLADTDVNVVFITTPHHLHSAQVCRALDAGKHVFVEKPLALTGQGLADVVAAVRRNPGRCLMVGFNRRFSPHVRHLRTWIGSLPSSVAAVLTINAGSVPPSHWTQDPDVGGGRVLGEGCHFIDTALYLVGRRLVDCRAFPLHGSGLRLGDCVTLELAFDGGSTASIHYFSNGSSSFPKERIEVFGGGKVLVCDNFRSSREYGGRGRFRTMRQDKGHAAELAAFFTAIRQGGDWPIPLDEMISVSEAAIAAGSSSV